MDGLTAALMPVMSGLADELAERVYETLNYFLQEYYKSYNPISYRRTYDFLRSAVKAEPKVMGNRVEAAVYIDYDSMDDYYSASGYDVAAWANKGLHGGLETEGSTPHVWDDTMENTVDNG